MNCKDCPHKKVYRKYGNKTASVYCEHPCQEHIIKYFNECRIQKMAGFIGFVNSKGEFPIKKSPKWCPLRKEGATECKHKANQKAKKGE